MEINVTISTGGQTTAVTIPEAKNTVQVTGGNITQAEREKLSSVEVGATADQTLSAGNTSIVVENGPNYQISLADTIRPENIIANGTISTLGTISGLEVTATSKMRSAGVMDVNKIQPFSFNGASDFFIRAGGGSIPKSVFIVESSNDRKRFEFSTSDSKFTVIPPGGGNSFSLPTSSLRSNGTPAQDGDLITFNASDSSTSFEEAPDISKLLNVGDVSTAQEPATFLLDLFNKSLVYSNLNDGLGARWVAFKDAYDYMSSQLPPVGSPPLLQQFVNEDLVSTDGSSASGLYIADGVFSVNQSGTIPSSLNFYVNGDARINGAIQVGDTSGVTYAFPTTDGTANQLLATDGSGAVTFVTPSTSNVTEGTNLYYTDARVAANSAVAANTAKVSYPTADSTKVAFISVTQAVDLDTMESDIATNNAKVGYTDSAVDTRIAAASIDDLSDVDTSTVAPTDGQALVWDNTASKWEPGTVSGGGSSPWTTSGSDIYYTTGNVGVGTTTPSESFSVQGQLQLEDSSGSGNILVNAGTSAITTGTNHIAIGNGTGQYVISGSNGVAIGNGASAGGVSNHIAIGPSSGRTSSLTSGYGDLVSIGRNAGRGNAWIVQDAIAIGYNAMGSSNGGVSSIAMGRESLYQTQFQDGDHIALGMRAMRVSNGNNNIAIGREAMSSITGSNNVAVGYKSGGVYNSGRSYSDNVAIGAYSGHHNNGGLNVLVGRDAGLGVSGSSTFVNTVAVGYQALTALTTGIGNTAVGYLANSTSTDANYNTSLGYEANAGNVSGDNSVAVGYQAVAGSDRAVSIGALANAATSDTVAIGYNSGPRGSGNPSSSIFIGKNAGNSAGGNGSGQRVVIGDSACSTNGGGRYSVYIGFSAGRFGSQNNNSSNVMIGAHAAYSHNSTTNSVGIGHGSMNGADTTGSVAIGFSSNAGDADYNTMIGYQAGNNSLLGGSNTMIGHQSGLALTTVNGANNVALGYQAGTALTEGGNNVLIGYQSGSTLTTESNKLYIENSNSTTPLIYGEFDNDIVRVNGTLQVNDPSSTGYAFPTATGTLGQVLEVDASGDLIFATPSGGGGGTPLASADQTLTGDRLIDTNGYNLAIELDPTGTADTFTIHDGTHDLFQVDTGTTGVLFSVNDVSGLPKLEVDEDEGIIAKSIKVDDGALTVAGQYGKGAEIWYQGTSTPTAGSVYYLDSSGNWANTDASAVATAKGMLSVSVGTDSDVDGMVIKGFVYVGTDPGGNVGDVVYLSETANQLTTTAPTTALAVVRVCGYKVGTNIVYFDPSKDWIELS